MKPEIKIRIDDSAIDITIEKVNQLKSLLQEVIALIDSLKI